MPRSTVCSLAAVIVRRQAECSVLYGKRVTDCKGSIENLKIYMSLYSYLKIILYFIVHHHVYSHKLCLIVGYNNLYMIYL